MGVTSAEIVSWARAADSDIGAPFPAIAARGAGIAASSRATLATAGPAPARLSISAACTGGVKMDRRVFLQGSAGALLTGGLSQRLIADTADAAPAGEVPRLTPPAAGKIRVAVALANMATVIDFAGPWEVFQDVVVGVPGDSEHEQNAFELYTVAASTSPIRATAGLHIIPDYSIADAPAPHVIVVGALGADDALRGWIKDTSAYTDLTMSVCTGAFQLARIGLLDGLTATTHHDFYDVFAKRFPAVTLVRNQRYVEHPRIATAGGLTSGMDLALRVVQRYFGTEVAQQTATYMEYQSTRWRDPA
jgi:putative intracellular protease/amidase